MVQRDVVFFEIAGCLATLQKFFILKAHLLVLLPDLAEFLLSHFRFLLEIFSDFDHSLHLILQNLHIVLLFLVAFLQLDHLVFVIAQ